MIKMFTLMVLGLVSVTAAHAGNDTDVSVEIFNPVYPGTKLPFSYMSSDDGICRILGYASAANGSSRESQKKSLALMMDFDQEIARAGSGSYIDRIVCLNFQKKSLAKIQQLRVIPHPKHNQSLLPFSYLSSDDGVCKYLGFKKAISGSSGESSVSMESIELNFESQVVSAKYATAMTRIICIK